MIRVALMLALLSGCSAAHVDPPPRPAINCPDAVPVPAPLKKGEHVGALEIRVELAREAEHDRGDCWRAAAMGAR